MKRVEDKKKTSKAFIILSTALGFFRIMSWIIHQYLIVPKNIEKRATHNHNSLLRSCEDIKNVAVCKETFNLYYYESDGRHDTPDWNKNKYTKIDTIAADRRFRPGERNASNKETREIGPLSKKGLYVAIQVRNTRISTYVTFWWLIIRLFKI